MSVIDKLDAIANSLESMGLVKEAASIDVVSNTLEKEAMWGMIKNIISKIPGAPRIENKQKAIAIIWDAVKKIGKERVIEAIDAVLKVMSQQTPFSTPERVADASGGLRNLLLLWGVGLITAITFLYMLLGSSGLENFKKQITQSQQTEQTYLQQLGQPASS